MTEDQDKIIESLSQAITKALRDLVRGIQIQGNTGNTLQLPGSGTEVRQAESQPAPPLAFGSKQTQVDVSQLQNQFTTLQPEQSRTAAMSPAFVTESFSTPPAYFQEHPEVPQRPVRPPLMLPTSPEPVDAVPSPTPHPSLDTHSKLDFKRGFSADDPTGRIVFHHEQDAQANRYDQTTDLLYDAMVKQSRVDRDYRERQYRLMQKNLQDANNDQRRLEDLERRHECSRENITDCNI